ncbi:MAG: 2-dehydro-3-deoxygluconokinase [Abditibacteriota bacterium]|nr:2-dehydro-3-deoxygluconokinase [Abditibacteriota bacterium]
MPEFSCDVVTVGESMVLFQPLPSGTIAHAPLFMRSVAGAESNVAIALSRLGLRTRWISRLGNDPFGDIVQSTLSGQGVDVSCVQRTEGAATAVFFRENKGWGEPNVFYFRRGSAASRLAPADVQPQWFEGARHLHVSGITPGLSESARDMILGAMKTARAQGLSVSFDPNIRRKMWDESTFWHQASCRETLLSMIPLCDVFLPGLDEARFLLDSSAPGTRQQKTSEREDLGRAFLERGASVVVLKLGLEGAVAFTREASAHQAAHRVESVVDTVGAGDAFAAGFLSVWLEQSTSGVRTALQRALRRANVLGALATQFAGDWESLPQRDELEAMEAGSALVTR